LYAIGVPRKPKPPRNSSPPGKPSAARGRSESAPAELRIIGGSMRGRKLAYSGDPQTRPMKDRVREAVFNLIGPAAKGKQALDLFAGTGALALEAISRGAVAATMLERHFPTAELIRKNCQSLGVAEITQVVPVNAFVWARRELAGEGGPRSEPAWRETIGDAPWLVFISPPFSFYLDRTAEMLALFEQVIAAAPAASIVVVEADTQFDLGQLPGADQWDARSYPPAVVAVYRKSDD
jgi:16S rRNA (guanine966-N2)-methyltransferase